MIVEVENTIELIETGEGIHTVRNNTLNESYHSMHGSLQESMHVFVKNGFAPCLSQLHKRGGLKILEMGFGTGLNALLTYRENLKFRRSIHYTTVEAFPLPNHVISKLNYFEFIEPSLQPVFMQMHECNWFETISLTPDPSPKERGEFFLYKIQADMLELKLEDSYDLVYYDAFSPTHQPELWTFEVLKKIYDACSPGAMLVTYCAKGEVKRMLQKTGFKVETLPGPRGKREMIRARKMMNNE